MVQDSVAKTLNKLLEVEAEKQTQTVRYVFNEQRQGYRSGYYSRKLTTTSGDVSLKLPKLKGISFELAIIKQYRRQESSVEETSWFTLKNANSVKDNAFLSSHFSLFQIICEAYPSAYLGVIGSDSRILGSPFRIRFDVC